MAQTPHTSRTAEHDADQDGRHRGRRDAAVGLKCRDLGAVRGLPSAVVAGERLGRPLGAVVASQFGGSRGWRAMA